MKDFLSLVKFTKDNNISQSLRNTTKMSEEDLITLRQQATIYIVQQICKDPAFLFKVSMGMKHFFKEFAKGDVHIGILHLEYRKDHDGCGYFKNTWYDTFADATEKAEEIQEKKVYDEDKLVNFVHSYFQDIYNPPERLYS